MNKSSFSKLLVSTIGVTAAALAIMASTPRSARAAGDDDFKKCEGGPQLCKIVHTCQPALPGSTSICTDDYYYQPVGT